MDIYASGKAKMAALAEEFPEPGQMNEAGTRLRVIDRILFDCLGWLPSEVEVEKHYLGEYSDYEIGKPAPEAVLEAKREGIYFTLPAGLAGRQSVDVQTLLEDQETKEALEQVLEYCQNRGVPIAILCNGHQLIAFYASRQDGVPPRKGRALVFSSLSEMHDEFQVLWNHLSRDGIAARNLQRALLGRQSRISPPPKLSEQIYDYPGFHPRSALETDLKLLGGIFIQDLESDARISDDFIRDCYCSSGALSQYALVSKEILRAKYDHVAQDSDVIVEPARTKEGPNPQLKLTADVMAAAMSRRPLIILGDIGVGKSMFLRHLIRVEAADVLEDALIFYVDFGKEPALSTDLESHVERRLAQQLSQNFGIKITDESFVRAVYNRELNEFKKGIYGSLAEEEPKEYRMRELSLLESLIENRAGHLRRSLEHLRATTQRRAVIVLDNIDQRPQDFQERVFLIAQSLAETWPATVFVSLRPSTFFESRSRGSLAAYQLRVFAVSPTRTDDVILKRLHFAQSSLAEAETGGVYPTNLSLASGDLAAYLNVLVRAFTHDDVLKALVDNLSGGNLRLALTFLSTFVGSGYVSTQRVLEAAEKGKTYVIPPHEFLAAVIYGDYQYFDPTASEICNLFDIRTNDGREHFLLPLLLAHAQRLGEAAGGDGFVDAEELFLMAQGLGYAQEQVGPQLVRAVQKRLLESPPARGVGGPYRITNVGSYAYKSLIRDFTYVDAMVVDTPIVDVSARQEIRDVRPILERLDRADRFVDYLDAQWAAFNPDAENLAFDWMPASSDLRLNIEEARTRAKRAAARRGR